MGYGPPVLSYRHDTEEEFGWCYRCQQGCGTRISPYFTTEEACDAFHGFLEKRIDDINKLMKRDRNTRLDLRDIPLFITQKFAEDFEKFRSGEVILADCTGETRLEFYEMDYMPSQEYGEGELMVHDARMTRGMLKQIAEIDEAWNKKLKREREAAAAAEKTKVSNENEDVVADEETTNSPSASKKRKV